MSISHTSIYCIYF